MACEPLFGCVWLAAFAFHARCLCVVLVVGLGVDRIVDACALAVITPPFCSSYRRASPAACGMCVGVLLFVLAY